MAWSDFSTKLAEIFDRHLGNLSRPSQIIKEAAAQGDALRLLAAAERDGELIRRGELDIQLPPGLARVPGRSTDDAQQLAYGQQIAARIVHQELRRDQNLEKIAYYATEEEGDGEVAQERDLDEDWLTQFFRNAQDVSTEQLQRIWARLLAGEIRSPGSYSIETIDFLRRMTTARAQQIQIIGPFLFAQDIVVIGEYIKTQKWSNLIFWLELDDMGVVNRDLVKTIKSNFPDRFENAFVYGEKVLLCQSDDKAKEIKLNAHRLTKLGMEMLSLGKFAPDYEYLTSIGQEIKKQDFTVSVGDLVEKSSGRVKFRNLKEVA